MFLRNMVIRAESPMHKGKGFCKALWCLLKQFARFLQDRFH